MNNKKIDWSRIGNQIIRDPRTWLILIAIIIFIISCIPRVKNVEISKDDDIIKNQQIVKKYKVKVHIDFEENIILSRYDVNIKSDDKTESLKHGEDKDFELLLKEGKRDITFVKDDDTSIKKTVTIDVTSSMEIGYKISCHYDRIDVEELYIDKDETLPVNQIKIDFNSSNFSGKNYKDVIKTLSELGFTNIEEKPVYDIIFDITPEGEIDTVTIDGKEDYKKGNAFDKDVKIVVSYHMKDDNDPSKAKSPYDSKSYVNVNYKDAEKAYKDAGFTNILLETVKTSTSVLDGNVYYITINGLSPDKSSPYDKDSKVLIKYYKYEKEESKKEEEEDYSDGKHQTAAKRAFEKMGESLYPYGIKYHWWVDRRDFSYKGNGVWHIEVGVTITNQYNAKREAVASGNVDFKAEKVKDFKVRNK